MGTGTTVERARPAGAKLLKWSVLAPAVRGSVQRISRYRRATGLPLFIVTPQLWPVLVPLMLFVFANVGPTWPWPWPWPDESAPPFASHSEPHRLSTTVQIWEDGAVYRVRVDGVDLDDHIRVTELLEIERRNWSILEPNDPFSRRHMVSIAASSETPWPVVRDAMRDLRELGLTDVDFLVMTPTTSVLAREAN